MKAKQKIVHVIVVAYLSLYAGTVLAQPTPGGGGPPGGGGAPVPLSGIEVLLAGGALLGFKKYLQSRKSSK